MFARRLPLILALTALLAISAVPLPWRPLTGAEQEQLAAALADTAGPVPAADLTPVIDSAFLSPDGQIAQLWLALQRPGGRVLAGEPLMALAARTTSGWNILDPGSADYAAALQTLPPSLLPPETDTAPALQAEATRDAARAAQAAALNGFKLPYAKGSSYWMEGSVLHFLYDSVGGSRGYPSCAEYYCANAFDFTDPSGNIFPLLAARDGYVLASRFSCPDGSPSCTNYIVLADNTDGVSFFPPYQIYIHFSQYKAPTWLKVGDYVRQGQYIGFADDTGYSTSSHLHFMVTNIIEKYDPYPWGPSVPIRFDDVKVNGGVPRSCYEALYYPQYGSECVGDKSNPLALTNDFFVSGNEGAFPPTAEILEPAAGAVLAGGSTNLVDVRVSARDGLGVTAVQLLANWNGRWVAAGPRVTTFLTQVGDRYTFDWDVDLCKAAPANGPLEIAVRAWDLEGNVTGPLAVRTVQVDHACPPPSAALEPLSDAGGSSAVALTWQAVDGGAGLNGFELQMRVNGGSWQVWEGSNTLTGWQRSAWLLAQSGQAYQLRLLAVDANGQREPEPAPGAFEAQFTGPTTCVPDSFEADSLPALLENGKPLERNLCRAGGQPGGDADSFAFDAETGRRYMIRLRSLSGGAAASLQVSLPDGSPGPSLPASALGENSALLFTAPQTGRYGLTVRAVEGLFGTQARYSVEAGPGGMVYLPLITR